MFLRNAWYVAACGHDVTRQLLDVQVLGDRIVSYRTESGAPVEAEQLARVKVGGPS
jgi:phenylpropionate dioxygenase-like ring-hydroxylating dioxygenase large terminal subunit